VCAGAAPHGAAAVLLGRARGALAETVLVQRARGAAAPAPAPGRAALLEGAARWHAADTSAGITEGAGARGAPRGPEAVAASLAAKSLECLRDLDRVAQQARPAPPRCALLSSVPG